MLNSVNNSRSSSPINFNIQSLNGISTLGFTQEMISNRNQTIVSKFNTNNSSKLDAIDILERNSFAGGC
jgi:hypothetical protein